MVASLHSLPSAPIAEGEVLRDLCPKHGPLSYDQKYGSRPYCPVCVAARQEEYQAEEARKAAECADRQKQADLARRMERCGVVGRFAAASFDTFSAKTTAQQNVRHACSTFAANVQPDSGAGLILIGPIGSGKTHLLSAMVRSVIADRGLTAYYVTARDLVRELRATWRHKSWEVDAWGNKPETEEDAITRLGDLQQLLVLDEIGASLGSEAERVQLLDVLDLRYRLRRPTVIASNLALPGIRDAIGDRSFDRLREGAMVLRTEWPSHRGPVAEVKS